MGRVDGQDKLPVDGLLRDNFGWMAWQACIYFGVGEGNVVCLTVLLTEKGMVLGGGCKTCSRTS